MLHYKILKSNFVNNNWTRNIIKKCNIGCTRVDDNLQVL